MKNGREQEARRKKREKIYEVRLTSCFGPTAFPFLRKHSSSEHELASNESDNDRRERERDTCNLSMLQIIPFNMHSLECGGYTLHVIWVPWISHLPLKMKACARAGGQRLKVLLGDAISLHLQAAISLHLQAI
jgi:hypothetical protein